jgi:hypothetical protein
MLSIIRKRVTYANVAMTLALVLAMTGGAYAAGKYVITSTKQISPKVLKALKGATGPRGSVGAAGPGGATGLTGKEGVAGKNGTNGVNGTDGTDGANGVSVAGQVLASENENCPDGGSEFTAAESKKTYACNGSPWVVGSLPKGASEYGEWNMTQWHKNGEFAGIAISFPVPLAANLDESAVHFVAPGATVPAECAGGSVSEPKAESGNLCVFESAVKINVPTGFEVIKTVGGTKGADKFGAAMSGATETEGEALASGSWAVTG